MCPKKKSCNVPDFLYVNSRLIQAYLEHPSVSKPNIEGSTNHLPEDDIAAWRRQSIELGMLSGDERGNKVPWKTPPRQNCCIPWTEARKGDTGSRF